MVLEEATTTTTAFSSSEPQSSFYSNDSVPSSSPDLYSGDRNPQILEARSSNYVTVAPGVYVRLDTLPQPPVWRHSASFSKALIEYCQHCSALLQRPVRQEEADALAYHFARAVRTASYGPPVGALAAIGFWYRGLADETFRFPGYTPNKEWFTPDRFGSAKGVSARTAWHSMRLGAYGIVGTVVGSILMWSYALTSSSVNRLMDPRLKELGETIKERARKGKSAEPFNVGQMAGGREVDQTGGQRQGETYDMARQRRVVQRTARERNAQSGGTVDDASPTGGMFMSDYQENETPSDSGVMSDGHVKQRDSQVRFEEAKREAQQIRDDGVGAAPKSSGSAWERLRQQASSGGPGQSSATSSRDASSTGDSFMFSQAEEDRQLARMEQQKRFDQRVEREREGKDFGSQSESWRR